MPPQHTDALMTLAELARFLHLGQKTVLKLARDKKIPALQLDKEWRFRREDIDIWLEKQLHGDKDAKLTDLTDGMEVPLGDVMSEEAIVHDMRARDALGAIEELAARAYGNNWLNDKPWFVGAVVEREALASTAMDGGVAFLHTRARDTKRISQPFVIVGRSYDGIDFGAPDGSKTYLFFLLGLKHDKLHLPILGRLARIMLRDPTTIARLRSTTSPMKMRDILQRLDTREMEGGPLPPVSAQAKTAKAAPVLDKDLRLRAIMRAQARRKHEDKKQEVEDRKEKAKRDKEDAAAARRAETAERRRVASEMRQEAARLKKEAAAAKREREREKKRAAAEKKKAAAAKKREMAEKKRNALAAKKKAAAAKKKAAAAKKRNALAAKKKAAAAKKKAAAAKKKAAAAKKKAAAAKKKAAAAKKVKKAPAKKKAAPAKKKGPAKKKVAPKKKKPTVKKSAKKKKSAKR